MAVATVFELVEAGEITPRKRTTVDDLEWGATWLEQYEGDPEDDPDVLTAMATAAQYLRREAAKRQGRGSR
jgi:hypothetical protein